MANAAAVLYVGDIDVGVTEEDLRRVFDGTGDDVISVKICTDELTHDSLGYGFVNYTDPQHAAKAMEVLNFTPLNGKCIRISYYNSDPTLRITGVGNLFVKNLGEEMDQKSLYNMFSPFGNIISCKLATDPSGHSKGYGFIQYSTEEASRNAMNQLNGSLLNGRELYVGPFVSKRDRETSNVFVKNLSSTTTECDLKTTFAPFGSITSVVVMRDENGNSKCFGFVSFEKEEDADKAIQGLNGKKWYVGRAQKKSEREKELKLLHEKEARERSLGQNNLYVKNLDDKIDNEKLNELFSPFGTITSCKVIRDSQGISKGFGFVAFSTSHEASKAITEMNGKFVCDKSFYVAIAEKKEVRRARMQALLSNKTPITISPQNSMVASHIAPVTPNMVLCPAGRHGAISPTMPLIPNVRPNMILLPMRPAVFPRTGQQNHYGHAPFMPGIGFWYPQQAFFQRPIGPPKQQPYRQRPICPPKQHPFVPRPIGPSKQQPSARQSNPIHWF